ncbi:MAG TPA: M20/M25/M40 family metallo-hydrolase, partial [Bacteroidota bacterium]|nr:M20/M25/M40 family metallo-hydrolase [Bacteroidota bacterium]
MKRCLLLCILLLHATALVAQNADPAARALMETIDTVAIRRIIEEGSNRSQVMETLSWLTDVCGARLTASPGHKRALDWAVSRLQEYGMSNVHREGWGPFGRGWYLKRYSANVTDPVPFPLLSYPKAWSPSTDGTVRGEVVQFDAKTDSALAFYRGKLKGKFVLLGDIQSLKAHFEPDATRMSDSLLLGMANAEAGIPRRRGAARTESSAEARRLRMFDERKFALCVEEDVAAVLTPNRGDDGTIFVQGASLPVRSEDTSLAMRPRIYDRNPPATVPQVAVAAEQYNRLVRLLAKGEKVTLEMNLEAAFTREDSAYNLIAELPGSDLSDEVVMIGAHLDSWHGGTGATDNGTGVASGIEAMRILATLHLRPRRTIRLALWSGEEEGLLGSRSYVRAHFGGREGDLPGGEIHLKPEAERFCA